MPSRPDKFRCFIASATNDLGYAEALQRQLTVEFETTVWRQGVFSPSTYPFPILASEAMSFDFAIFILSENLKLQNGRSVPNLNVVLELGLFAHAVGVHRVFIAVPEEFDRALELPTDIKGFTLIPFDNNRSDRNLDASMGVVASSVKTKVKYLNLTHASPDQVQVDIFPRIQSEFEDRLVSSRQLTTAFVHSRRWRENHGHTVRSKLAAGDFKITAFLPNPDNAALMRLFEKRYDDGPEIGSFIRDSIRWYKQLRMDFPSVEIFLYPRELPYSCYCFDDIIFLALYPMASERRPSPTLSVRPHTIAWDFVRADLLALRNDCDAI